MDLVLRYAKPDDAAAVSTIRATAWQHAYRGIVPHPVLDRMSAAPVLAAAEREWAGTIGQGGVIVADLDGRVIGFAKIAVGEEPGVGEIEYLYVKPGLSRMGAGTALVEACLKEMRERLRLRSAVLWTFAANAPARVFYEKLGWRLDGGRRERAMGGVTVESVRYRRSL